MLHLPAAPPDRCAAAGVGCPAGSRRALRRGQRGGSFVAGGRSGARLGRADVRHGGSVGTHGLRGLRRDRVGNSGPGHRNREQSTAGAEPVRVRPGQRGAGQLDRQGEGVEEPAARQRRDHPPGQWVGGRDQAPSGPGSARPGRPRPPRPGRLRAPVRLDGSATHLRVPHGVRARREAAVAVARRSIGATGRPCRGRGEPITTIYRSAFNCVARYAVRSGEPARLRIDSTQASRSNEITARSQQHAESSPDRAGRRPRSVPASKTNM